MATYYLNADTGSDSGVGSSAAPWKTLVYAVANSTTGDTLYCQNSAATFDYRATTITGRNIVGQSTAGVVFDGANTDYTWTLGTGTTSISYITIQNVGDATGVHMISITGSTVPILTITGCIFKNCVAYGVNSLNGIVGVVTTSNGIMTVTIQGCIFDNIDFVGSNYSGYFSMRGGAAGSEFNFYNNIFFIQTNPVGTLDGIFISFNNSTNITWNFKNSIFRCVSGTAHKFSGSYATPSSMTMTNCSYTGLTVHASIVKVNCQTSDPLFIDENNSNFDLKSTSPCIDAGVVL